MLLEGLITFEASKLTGKTLVLFEGVVLNEWWV
jgi:hypothetical protein